MVRSETAYRWQNGHLSEIPLPPHVVIDGDILLRAGEVADGAEEMIPAACAIVAGVAPWVTAYFAPQVFQPAGEAAPGFATWRIEAEGREWECIGGQGDHKTGRIVASYRDTTQFLSTVYHEIFHAIEFLLPAQTWGLIDRQVCGAGRAYPVGYPGQGAERRARLFAAFAEYLDEGGGVLLPAQLDPARTVHEALFWIHSGDFARWRAAQAAAQAAEAAKRARRARRWAAVRQLIGV